MVRLQLRFELYRIHPRDNLPGIDHVSFADENIDNSARELGGNLYFFRFHAAVGLGKTCGKRILLLLPPIPSAGSANRHDPDGDCYRD